MKPPFISQTGTACDGQCSSSLPHFHAQLPPSLSNYPRVPDFRVELVPNDEQSSPSKRRAYSPHHNTPKIEARRTKSDDSAAKEPTDAGYSRRYSTILNQRRVTHSMDSSSSPFCGGRNLTFRLTAHTPALVKGKTSKNHAKLTLMLR